jgi:hypothetical protein
MRKQLIGRDAVRSDEHGLDLEHVATVEMTSEDPAHPIESALSGHGSGWRASGPGEQVIRLHFDEPQRLRRIDVLFEEHQQARTQEFVLRWSPDHCVSYREIVRQQYTFSPPSTSRETEQYVVVIDGATELELRIVPSIDGGAACASLRHLRIG